MDSTIAVMHQQVRSQLNKTIFEGFIKVWTQSDPGQIKQLGLHDETLERLRNLTFHQVTLLADDPVPFIFYHIDESKMCHALAKVERRTFTYNWTDELIKLNAPWPMMEALVGMTKAELVARRKKFGIKRPHGRLGKLPAKLVVEVLNIWSRLKDQELMERCVCLSQESKLTLDRLWLVIQKDIYPAY